MPPRSKHEDVEPVRAGAVQGVEAREVALLTANRTADRQAGDEASRTQHTALRRGETSVPFVALCRTWHTER